MPKPSAPGAQSDSVWMQVTQTSHRALGPMRLLELGWSTAAHARSPAALSLRLLPQEAHTLGLALQAVAEGRSPERELFMSPMASNGLFVGHVDTQGVAVELATDPGLPLDWPQVRRLAALLLAETPPTAA